MKSATIIITETPEGVSIVAKFDPVIDVQCTAHQIAMFALQGIAEETGQPLENISLTTEAPH
jgi:hypothetical protein